ncbi:MAG: Cysteine-tRNA ligase [candidate division WS6 bacterium GW2011_GWF2_39_15]|uniref:Cysteine--tRNA ligase n=1 Tax=candidate division WS6 bacterium GW2011_GWF2_39_15 TaxID=1619100 RepID=A0A0G0MT44_9BACT|nr:MAG: Cysteine-tRNA ligase [candidate division WS6 bacterium GW2011_GWF2_39_15]
MKLYNTLTRKLEEITPNEEGIVTMYNCGPTVYSRQHIGNFRAFVNWDVLHRSLLYNGYVVERIMNITDVGHLTSDEDFGEDKLEKGARQSGMNDPFKVADHFTNLFIEDFLSLNMLTPSGESVKEIPLENLLEYGWIRATHSIGEIISLIKEIEKSGYTYETEKALYFDVTKYGDYTKLSGQKLEEKLVGAREDVNVDTSKKNPADFVLWFKRVGEYKDHVMHWTSPWGDGFPGWHIECSAMGINHLGGFISIHTGGIEHIPVHHSNERAQNWGAYHNEIVAMWVHNEHLKSKGGDKLAKSLGNAYNLSEIIDLGYDLMDLRWLLASINYRMPINFSHESLEGARNSRETVMNRLRLLNEKSGNVRGHLLQDYIEKFKEALNDNLNMSEAFALLSSLTKSSENPADIVATALDFDKVLGLKLSESLQDVTEDIPEEVSALVEKRKMAREQKNFELSDILRKEIEDSGYFVKDTSDGQKLERMKK